jgi:serine/threonine protein kinase
VFNPEDFLREAEAMCRLDHPNIIHFYGYVKSPSSLVMEYCDQSLEAYLRVGFLLSHFHLQAESKFRGEEYLRLAKGITAGLSYLHAKDIIHKDLKPPNILLSGSERIPRLAGIVASLFPDFGLTHLMAPGAASTILSANGVRSDSELSRQ